MARIFTISFFYNNTMYNTMVTVRTMPFYVAYTLTNIETDLLRLLPGNTMISPSPMQIVFPDARPEHSTALMKTLIKAVEEHLQALAG